MAEINCTLPNLITESDLQAYAQGEASSEIATHLFNCPACQYKVDMYKQLYTRLRSVLWRQNCPLIETLLDYYAGYLPIEQKITVGTHIAVCPHCQDELRELTSLAKGETSGDSLGERSEYLLSGVRLEVGQIIHPIDGLLPVLRGETRETLLFEAGNTAVSINVELTVNGRFILHGQVLTEQDIKGQVRLTAVNQSAQESPLSPTGTFTITEISPGDYQLIVTLSEQQIVLPMLSIKR